jgi:site-specific DNA recombinase
LTGSASKGKYERYFYYHCQPGCKERHPADLTNDELIPEFRKISATKESLQLYQMILEKELKKSGNDNSEEKKKINSEIQKNQERIDKAEQLMLDGQLEMSEYKAIKDKYEHVVKDLKVALTPIPQKGTDYKKYLDFGFNLLQYLDRIYVSAEPPIKNQILSSILAEKLVFDGKKYRTPTYHEVLTMIFNDIKPLQKNKKGQSQNLSALSSGVVPTGIEPVSRV